MVQIDIMRGNRRAMNLQGEEKMAERMNVCTKEKQKERWLLLGEHNLPGKAAASTVNALQEASSLQMQQYSIQAKNGAALSARPTSDFTK